MSKFSITNNIDREQGIAHVVHHLVRLTNMWQA